MTRRPGFIYFDLGNVLVNFSHELACRQMAELAGVESERVRRVVFESGLEDAFESGQVTSRQFYEHFCREVQSQPPFEQLLEAASAIFELNEALVPLIGSLHATGIPLGILSNTNEAHWDYCAQGRYAPLGEFFSVRALSFQLGVMKPDRRIYEAAARLCGRPAEDIFFLDDRPENVAGAREAGFDAVLYTSVPQLAADLERRGFVFGPP